MAKQGDLLQGTLEMLILKALSLQPVHGYGILVRIQQLSMERLQIQQGSLYPALYRLESRGLLRCEWGEGENGRKAKFYRLTPAGKRQLKVETEQWKRLGSGVAGVLDALARRRIAGNFYHNCATPPPRCVLTAVSRNTPAQFD